MWVSESFPTLPALLGFLNDRRLRADRCKVVAARDAEGAQVFHLLYQTDGDGERERAAAAAEEEEALGADEAVGAAEAIVAGAQREE
jgi:hypothetical protein